MAKWSIPGGSLAVVRDGRLVLAHGFGWADREAGAAVEPDAQFRIASLSKALTAATVLRLVEEGKLSLDERAFVRLARLRPRPGARANPDLLRITVRQLLQHTAGWNRDRTFDPMFLSRAIAVAMGVPSPPDAETIVRYMLDQPLQAPPGTQYSYSNFGYCVLGRLIEEVTGQKYEDAVRARILRPAGAVSVRLGRTRIEERAPREVHYYDPPELGDTQSVFGAVPARVPWPYGGWSIEAMDAHGGWIASASDLARIVTALESHDGKPGILSPESVRLMTERPAPPPWRGSDTWYGMGWQVRSAPGGANWWHTGSLDGTTTLMVRAGIGVTWVVLFNTRPKDADRLSAELDQAMWRAVEGVRRWPATDSFAR